MPEPSGAPGILRTVKAGERVDLTRQVWLEAHPATIRPSTYGRSQQHAGNAASGDLR